MGTTIKLSFQVLIRQKEHRQLLLRGTPASQQQLFYADSSSSGTSATSLGVVGVGAAGEEGGESVPPPEVEVIRRQQRQRRGQKGAVAATANGSVSSASRFARSRSCESGRVAAPLRSRSLDCAGDRSSNEDEEYDTSGGEDVARRDRGDGGGHRQGDR